MAIVLESRFDAQLDTVVAEIKPGGPGGDRTVELDSLVSWKLEPLLAELGGGPCPRVVLDLERVAVLDSATLWGVRELGRKLRERGGGLALVGLNPGLLEMVELTGTCDSARPHESVERAVAALKERR